MFRFRAWVSDWMRTLIIALLLVVSMVFVHLPILPSLVIGGVVYPLASLVLA